AARGDRSAARLLGRRARVADPVSGVAERFGAESSGVVPVPATPRDVAAFARLRALGHEHGLALDGARVRRTSSRFCLGVEHGDYNGTELLGVGTDRFLWLAHAPSGRSTLRFLSGNFADEGVVEVDPRALPARGAPQGWARYAVGAVAVLEQAGLPVRRGCDVVLLGDIPGGGMSRSASLCVNLL